MGCMRTHMHAWCSSKVHAACSQATKCSHARTPCICLDSSDFCCSVRLRLARFGIGLQRHLHTILPEGSRRSPTVQAHRRLPAERVPPCATRVFFVLHGLSNACFQFRLLGGLPSSSVHFDLFNSNKCAPHMVLAGSSATALCSAETEKLLNISAKCFKSVDAILGFFKHTAMDAYSPVFFSEIFEPQSPQIAQKLRGRFSDRCTTRGLPAAQTWKINGASRALRCLRMR